MARDLGGVDQDWRKEIGDRVEIVEYQQRRRRLAERRAEPAGGDGRRGPPGAGVAHEGAVGPGPGGDLGRETRLADSRRPGEHDQATTAAQRLAPCSPQPGALPFPPGQRARHLELEREACLGAAAGRAPFARQPLDRLDEIDRSLEALELERSGRREAHVGHAGRPLGDRLRDEHLSRDRLRAQAGRGVQGCAAVSVLDRNGLPQVDADADEERQPARRCRLLATDGSELGRRPHGLRRRLEDRQGLVAAQLDHLAAAGLHGVACELGEARGEPRGLGVAVNAGEPRVPADVGDQEDPLHALLPGLALTRARAGRDITHAIRSSWAAGIFSCARGYERSYAHPVGLSRLRRACNPPRAARPYSR